MAVTACIRTPTSSGGVLGRAFLLSVVVAICPSVGAAALLHVDDDSCPSGDGSAGDPYCTIQEAICAAVSGDVVSVEPGTYAEAIRMRPGVDVVSVGGPSVTTIDASGQPCTDSDFCSKRAGNQCSVVTYSSGHAGTLLDGFTLTGGAGNLQSTKVAGGGVFVFSDAVVTNNVITGNHLAGPRDDFFGGGIYVAVGNATITGNVIAGNSAIPAAGSSGALTFAYGGGIWVSSFSSATITDNVIDGNTAGDSALAYSIGAGGGIIVFPGPATLAGTVIDGNIIANNISDSQGGGLAVLSPPGSDLLTRVTNNIIDGNAARLGGGVYTYFNNLEALNNTITDNLGRLGGGLYSGPSDDTLPVTLSNNIIESNRLVSLTGPTGGGVYTLDLDPVWDPTLEANDLWNNEKNQIDGDRTDGDTIGFDGNFSADPLFVDRLGGDYHLDPNSPAVDRAFTTLAPAVDFDDTPRGFDGDGIPDSPQVGDVDVGAYELGASCVPETEVCDGIDNNCDEMVDEGFADTDTDGIADCVDPDDDNDGVDDGADCAPLDAAAFGLPVEVTAAAVSGPNPTELAFATQNIGSGTRYEVVGGLVSRLRAVGGFGETFCAADMVLGPPWTDPRSAPPAGDAWYYAVRSVNACGDGPFGHPLLDLPRPSGACPAGISDADADGSPSDLDCDDTDGANAPFLPEACDGADNNCNGMVDDGFPDSDADGMDDCQDTDDDNDGVADGADCAPLDASAFAVPVSVDGLQVGPGAPTPLSWTEVVLGGGTTYAVAGGDFQSTGGLPFASGTCVVRAPASPVTDDRPDPVPGAVRYYLVRPENACGSGTYGNAGRDALPTCP